MRGAFEAMHRARTAIVDAFKVGPCRAAIHRERSNAEHAFELVEKLERIAARPVKLVMKVKRGMPRSRQIAKSFFV